MKGNRSLTRKEIISVVNNSDISNRDSAIFVLLVNSGMRISEALSLKIKDVSTKFAKIHSSVYLEARNTKTHEGSNITLNSSAKKALQSHVKDLLKKGLGVNDALFGGRKGGFKKAISRVQAHRIFKAIFESCGITGGKLATHVGRKTFSSRVYEATGHDLVATKSLLRHRSIQSTLSYLESALASLQQAVLNLEY